MIAMTLLGVLVWGSFGSVWGRLRGGLLGLASCRFFSLPFLQTKPTRPAKPPPKSPKAQAPALASESQSPRPSLPPPSLLRIQVGDLSTANKALALVAACLPSLSLSLLASGACFTFRKECLGLGLSRLAHTLGGLALLCSEVPGAVPLRHAGLGPCVRACGFGVG